MYVSCIRAVQICAFEYDVSHMMFNMTKNSQDLRITIDVLLTTLGHLAQLQYMEL